MKITTKQVQMLVIEDAPRLDPIRVVSENLEPGKGRIIIVCYDAAWVGYWGSMSGKTVEQFFMSCDFEYLASNLLSASGLRRGDHHREYLHRIIQAVQDALQKASTAHAEPAQAATN
jgi:hypothetical protein